jgi:chromosome segregation ATPase
VVRRSVTDNLALVDRALATTQDGLAIVGQMVQTTVDEVTSLQATAQAVALAIHDTSPMLDSLIDLTSRDFPKAVDATKTSLASAQSSAQLIDNVLAALTSIPFSPVKAYKPEVPLHTALGKVSTSLDPLKSSLTSINTSLVDGKTNLGTLEDELNEISETTQGISQTLGSAQTVVDQYKDAATQLKARVETAQRRAPGWITTISLILSFGLFWLLIVQLYLGMQGFTLLRDQRRS